MICEFLSELPVFFDFSSRPEEWPPFYLFVIRVHHTQLQSWIRKREEEERYEVVPNYLSISVWLMSLLLIHFGT